MSRQGVLWISWHDSSRSRNLARLLGAPLLSYVDRPYGLRRHLSGSAWTVRMLTHHRPRLVFLQNSFMLLLIVAAYKRLTPWQVRVVADCHNKSLLRQLEGPLAPVFRYLKRWSFAAADLVLVSNSAMFAPAGRLSNHVLALRDSLPRELAESATTTTTAAGRRGQPADRYVLFPCSFDHDEPIAVILAAARQIAAAGFRVVITGDSRRLRGTVQFHATPSVCLTGWLSHEEYRDRVLGAAAIIALTDDRDCLMCAAYEALAARRPLVVSDWPVARACFGDAATYTTNTPAAVAQHVLRVLERPAVADNRGIAAFTRAFEDEFQTVLEHLTEIGLPVAVAAS